MRIIPKVTAGVPYFCVLAETVEERLLLNMFYNFGDRNKRKYVFRLQSATSMADCVGYTNFTFGWEEEAELKNYVRQAKNAARSQKRKK